MKNWNVNSLGLIAMRAACHGTCDEWLTELSDWQSLARSLASMD
jgi:hypothetical protein